MIDWKLVSYVKREQDTEVNISIQNAFPNLPLTFKEETMLRTLAITLS